MLCLLHISLTFHPWQRISEWAAVVLAAVLGAGRGGPVQERKNLGTALGLVGGAVAGSQLGSKHDDDTNRRIAEPSLQYLHKQDS